MIIYTQHCLPCAHKARFKQVKRFAQSNGFELEERRTSYSKLWQKEADNIAKRHGVTQPFIHHEGKTINLNEDLEKLLPSKEVFDD